MLATPVMKKCEYCGCDNADEVVKCKDCGKDWFSVTTQATEPNTGKRKGLFAFRLLTALLMGFAVICLSLDVAWQHARSSLGTRGEQWLTQWRLDELNEGMNNYRSEFNAFPHSLDQLKAATNNMQRFNNEEAFVDGWKRKFVYSFEGTNGVITSYGRDGKPGGEGLDYDLENLNSEPKASKPTFYQFIFDMPIRKVITSCLAVGGIVFLLCFFTIKKPDLSRAGIVTLMVHLVIIFAGAWFVAGVISVLHLSSGH